MKAHYIFAPALLMAVMIQSCSDGEVADGLVASPNYLEVPVSVSITGDEASAQLQIKSGCSWTILSSDSWLTVTPTSGNGNATVTLTSLVNPSSLESRSSQISINTSDRVHVVSFSQSAASESLETSLSALNFDYTGGMKGFSIQSNGTWSISSSDSWVALSRTSGEGSADISVQVNELTDDENRSSVLTVRGNGLSRQIEVHQTALARTLTMLSAANVHLGCADTETEIVLEGNSRWSIFSSESWAVPQMRSGEGDAVIPVYVQPNTSLEPREAVITINTSKTSLECHLSQEAAALPVLSKPEVSEVDKHSARIKGTCVNPGAGNAVFSLSSFGLHFGTSADFEAGSYERIEVTNDLTGNIDESLTGLRSGVRYFVRTFAVNIVGEVFSEVVEFTTEGGVPGEDDNVSPEL